MKVLCLIIPLCVLYIVHSVLLIAYLFFLWYFLGFIFLLFLHFNFNASCFLIGRRPSEWTAEEEFHRTGKLVSNCAFDKHFDRDRLDFTGCFAISPSGKKMK